LDDRILSPSSGETYLVGPNRQNYVSGGRAEYFSPEEGDKIQSPNLPVLNKRELFNNVNNFDSFTLIKAIRVYFHILRKTYQKLFKQLLFTLNCVNILAIIFIFT
jgi:hypothetical protein